MKLQLEFIKYYYWIIKYMARLASVFVLLSDAQEYILLIECHEKRSAQIRHVNLSITKILHSVHVARQKFLPIQKILIAGIKVKRLK